MGLLTVAFMNVKPGFVYLGSGTLSPSFTDKKIMRFVSNLKVEVDKTGGVNAMLMYPEEGDFFVIHLMNKGFYSYSLGQSLQDILVALRNNRWTC